MSPAVIIYMPEKELQWFCQELLATGLIDNFDQLEIRGVKVSREEFP
jgi:hypothetical protein